MSTSPEDTQKLDGLNIDPDGTAITPVPQARHAPDGKAYLVHIHPRGPTYGARYVIGPTPVVIGRDDGCGVADPDASVSRRHAVIQPEPDGRFTVTDIGSRNGTYVNHARVDSATLTDGDYLRVGNSIYRFLAGGNIEADYHEELRRLAVTDPLTGLHNRRAMTEFLEREADRARRRKRPLSVILFDIDHFKAINDRIGHMGGDFTLRTLAGVVRVLVRRDELLARYGGEEFAVVLPETTTDQARKCGERIRAGVAEYRFEYEGREYAVTVSVGIGAVASGEGFTVADLLDRADKRLYEAKRTGRNRVSA